MTKVKTLMAGAMSAVLCATCAWAEDTGENATFSTPGPDKYEDGKQVIDGECYALVWTKEGEDFPGVTWDFKSADTNIAEIVKILAQASGGKCPATTVTGGTHEDGAYEVVLLDTRKPKEKDALTGLAAGKEDALVTGWTIIDSTGAQEGWHTVKIAAEGKSFSFNVLANVADGYGVVSPADGVWTVYPLPTAYTKIIAPASISSLEGYAMLIDPSPAITEDPFSLDVTYQFDAFDATVAKVVAAITNDLPKDKWGCADFKDFNKVNDAATAAVIAGKITPEEAAEAGDFLYKVYPFWDWNCDFEISFDDDVKAGSFILGGKYAQAGAFGALYQGWVCSSHDKDLAKGETMRLLEDNNHKGVYVTYYEICSRVQEFLCGVRNNSTNNWGKTITVKLNMYENTGRCNESGYKTTVGTYRYRFEGPLNIVFRGEGLPEGVTLPADIHTNGYEKAQQLPKPTNWPDGMMFAGWKTTNDVAFAGIPANYFRTAEDPLVLVATWETCQSVQVEEKTLDIKVDDEWIEENVGIDPTQAQIEAKLDETNSVTGNANWIDYVLNQSAAIEVTDTKTGVENTIPVESNLEVPKADTGFKVQYSLDKVEADEKTVVVEGELEDTRDLSIDLSVEQPTGYYKMNVIVTAEDGEGESVKVTATNTIGVLKVETAQTPVIVAVPWTLIESNVNITVAKVIKTSTLSEGDVLHIYNTESEPHFYYAWEVKNNAWSPISVWDEEQGLAVMSPDPAIWTIPRGIGMWLERTDVSKPFYLSGLYNTAEIAKTQIEAGTETEPAYNLIAPPSIEPTNLNDIESLNEKTVDPHDQIMVVGGTVPKTYTYEGGKWGYTKTVYKLVGSRMRATTVRVTDDSVIPAGTGAWYVSGGGSPEIEWTNEREVAE